MLEEEGLPMCKSNSENCSKKFLIGEMVYKGAPKIKDFTSEKRLEHFKAEKPISQLGRSEG